MQKVVSCLVLAVAAFLLTTPTPAEEKKKADAPDEKASLEAMMKAATPGEHHKKLDPLAGSWEFSIKMWMDPSKPPTESKGTAEQAWVLGKRYLHQKVKGEFGGMEFLGEGWLGYDNLQKKYVYSWIDNMGTGISTSTGTADKDGKTFIFADEMIDPVSGEKVKGRSVMKISSNDKYESIFYKNLGGQEVKVMEIAYSRKK